MRLCSSRRSPSCDQCVHVACEPLETWAGLWILTPPSALQPSFLLSYARPFTVQQLVRLATGLFSYLLLCSFLSLLPLVLSFIDPCTMVSRKHSQGKPSPTLLAPIRLLVAPPETMPSADLCHCTWPHRSAGICCGYVSLRAWVLPGCKADPSLLLLSSSAGPGGLLPVNAWWPKCVSALVGKVRNWETLFYLMVVNGKRGELGEWGSSGCCCWSKEGEEGEQLCKTSPTSLGDAPPHTRFSLNTCSDRELAAPSSNLFLCHSVEKFSYLLSKNSAEDFERFVL